MRFEDSWTEGQPASLHPAFTLATAGRRLAAGAFDAVILGGGALVTSAIGFLLIAVIGNEDFDGPPAFEAWWGWLFYASVLGAALLFAGVEAFGRRTPGKQVFGLMLVRDGGAHGAGSYGRRYVIKYGPLIAVATLCCTALMYNRYVAWPGAWEGAWRCGWEVPLSVGVAGAVMLGSFGCCGRGSGSLYDRLSGTIVVVGPAAAPARRGFAVLCDVHSRGVAPEPR
jgi:uncharacterized RDD family membrane protein YckC